LFPVINPPFAKQPAFEFAYDIRRDLKLINEMIKNNNRICDVCGENVPKASPYQKVILKPEIAELFFNKDLDISPTWTNLPNGNVQLEICLDCYLSMGKSLQDKIEH